MPSGQWSTDPGQLPRGPHSLTRGAVVENQRQRLVRAVPAAVRDKGFAALTVEDITPSGEKPFDAVRAAVNDDWRADQRHHRKMPSA